MYDSMNLLEACSDLFHIGLKSDKLQLLYNANKQVKFKGKTPSGLTEEKTMNEIVMQGDTLSSTMAAVQFDAFGKNLLEEDVSYFYKYKGTVPIGILGQIDDLVGVTEPGYKAQQMNAYLNVMTVDKYLQFGPDKCKTMLVRSMKKKFKFLHTILQVDTSNQPTIKKET